MLSGYSLYRYFMLPRYHYGIFIIDFILHPYASLGSSLYNTLYSPEQARPVLGLRYLQLSR